MLLLSGCGGVMDSTVTHRLDVRIGPRTRAAASRGATVAIRSYKDVAFDRPQPLIPDATGEAHATFEERWGRAFLIIPPIGSFPPRPPKPDYMVAVGGRQTLVSPNFKGVSYRWENGGWHTRVDVAVSP